MRKLLLILSLGLVSCWMLERSTNLGHSLEGPVDTLYTEKSMLLKFVCTSKHKFLLNGDRDTSDCKYFEYFRKPLK